MLEPDQFAGMTEVCRAEWEKEVVAVLAEWWSKDAEVVSWTSGSTGHPKPIKHSRKAMLESAKRTIKFFGLAPGTRASLVMPARFIGGKMMLIRAIAGGWDLRIEKPARSPQLQLPSDFVSMTVAQAQAMVKDHPESWSQLNLVLLGGGPVSSAAIAQLLAGPEVYASFGMTETVSHFALRQLAPQTDELFTCLPGFSVDKSSNESLQVIFPDGKRMGTNDAVETEGSQKFRWLGRLDDAIISGGVKVHPAQVEAAMAAVISHPFKVYGSPHREWGQEVVLRVHAAESPPEAKAMEESWKHYAISNLPKYHAPRRIEWKPVEQTPSGKWIRPNHSRNFADMKPTNPSGLPILVFATHNANKAAEVQRMLGNAYHIQTLTDIGCHEEIPETAPDLRGNARIKARHVYDAYGLDCFADDTGLEVDGLSGAPGVKTARYAGEDASAEQNMKKLLAVLSETRPSDRKARFRTVICLVRGGTEAFIEGTCEGKIALEQSGIKGFGYDPIFEPAGESVTFAEMSQDAKNEISHRGKAIRGMVGELLGKS